MGESVCAGESYVQGKILRRGSVLCGEDFAQGKRLCRRSALCGEDFVQGKRSVQGKHFAQGKHLHRGSVLCGEDFVQGKRSVQEKHFAQEKILCRGSTCTGEAFCAEEDFWCVWRSLSEGKKRKREMQMLSTLPVIERTVAESKAVMETTDVTKPGGIPIWLLVLVIVVGVLALAALVLLSILLIRQKNSSKKESPIQETVVRDIRPMPEKEIPKVQEENHSFHTQRLWSSGTESDQERESVIVRDIMSPERFFKVSLDGGVVIGRSVGDILLPGDKFISSKHCELTYQAGILYIKDLNSANGTFYEGQKLDRKTAVRNGGIIKVGETELKLEVVKEKN